MSEQKDKRAALVSAMVDRFLGWRLPADFSPDCGISFKRESDYEHPQFGRTKFEPVGTNLFTADQAKAMFEYVLAAPEAPASDEGAWSWERRAEAANNFLRNYADASMEKLLGDYEVQPIIRRLAAAIKEWQEDVIRQAPEVERLRAAVEEWLCDACNTVYPGPPQPGFACVMCPKCSGRTGPRLVIENDRLRATSEHADDLREMLWRAANFMRGKPGLTGIETEARDLLGRIAEGLPPLNFGADLELGRLLDAHRSAKVDHSIQYGKSEHGISRKALIHHLNEQVRQAQRDAKALGYALGRGAAVQDYVCLNDAALADARRAAVSTTGDAAVRREPAPDVVYERPAPDPVDPFTRTTRRSVALRWKQAGSLVAPDPEVE